MPCTEKFFGSLDPGLGVTQTWFVVTIQGVNKQVEDVVLSLDLSLCLATK